MADKKRQDDKATSNKKSEKSEISGKSDKMPTTNSSKISGTVGAVASVGNIKTNDDDENKTADSSSDKRKGRN